MNDQQSSESSGQSGPRVQPEPPSAKSVATRWPGWIWAIPIAAVLIVGWLAVKSVSSGGPAVTVEFKNAAGIQAGTTAVEYHGLKVGMVESAHLEKDLAHVRVRIRLDAAMAGHLGKGTQFWIANAKPSLTNPASLKSIISGPTIGILPRPGKKQKIYQGLDHKPAVPETVPGRHFMLVASRLGGISSGTPIYFSDLQVGSVENTRFLPDRQFLIKIFVAAPYDKLVHTGTRFWNAGAIHLAMQPSGPELRVPSIAALGQGSVDFETPTGPDEGPPAPDHQRFTLYGSEDAAVYAPGTMAVTYQVVFPAAAGGLQTNAGVELAGKRIGTVTKSVLEYDFQTGTLFTRATIALEPQRIVLAHGARWAQKPRPQMNRLLTRLIASGLRAELDSSVPMVGPKNVTLAFRAGPSDAGLISGNPPVIPSSKGGSGIGGIMSSVSTVANKLNSLPLDQIGANLKVITGRLAALSQSPQLTATLKRLDQSVTNVQHLTASANREVPALVRQLKYTATQADAAVREVRTILNNQSGVTATGTQTAGLTQTLYELSRAARSIRNLADMIARDPTMLIRGKG